MPSAESQEHYTRLETLNTKLEVKVKELENRSVRLLDKVDQLTEEKSAAASSHLSYISKVPVVATVSCCH